MMLIFVLILALVGAAGYYWYTQQQKKKGASGDIYRADLTNDCTLKGATDVPQKGTIDIEVKTSNLFSVVAIGQPTMGGAEDNQLEKLQTAVVLNSGCINYTTDGDAIKYDFKNTDLRKWIGSSEPFDSAPKIVFTRKDKDTITATEPITGSTCKFTRVKDEKTDSSCEKPSIGCRMM